MNGTHTSATLRVLGVDLAFSSAERYHVEWSGQDPRGNLEIVATLSHGTTRPRPEGAWAVRLTHIEAHRSCALKAHAHSIGEAEAQILVPLRGAIDLAERLCAVPAELRSRGLTAIFAAAGLELIQLSPRRWSSTLWIAEGRGCDVIVSHAPRMPSPWEFTVASHRGLGDRLVLERAKDLDVAFAQMLMRLVAMSDAAKKIIEMRGGV